MSTSTIYQSLNTALKSQGNGLTAPELQGFLSGILAGGYSNENWHVLVADMINNGTPLTENLADQTVILYKDIKNQLNDPNFEFHLLLHEDDLHQQIDDLVGWLNHFLLGLGLVQPKIADIKGDVGEVISDLRQITQLGYDENEDQQELAFAFEEILEYVRMATILCHDEFSQANVAPTLH